MEENHLKELEKLRKENLYLKESLQDYKNQDLIFQAKKKSINLKQNQLELEISSLKDIICKLKKKLMVSEQQYGDILQRNLELETKIELLEEEIDMLRENLGAYKKRYTLEISVDKPDLDQDTTLSNLSKSWIREFQVSPYQKFEKPKKSFEEIYLVWFPNMEILLKNLSGLQSNGTGFYYQIIELLGQLDRIIFPCIQDMKCGLLIYNLFGKAYSHFVSCFTSSVSSCELLRDTLLSSNSWDTMSQIKEKLVDAYGELKITSPCTFFGHLPKSLKSPITNQNNKISLVFGLYFILLAKFLKIGISLNTALKTIQDQVEMDSENFPDNSCSNVQFVMNKMTNFEANFMHEEGTFIMSPEQKVNYLHETLRKIIKKIVKHNLSDISLAEATEALDSSII